MSKKVGNLTQEASTLEKRTRDRWMNTQPNFSYKFVSDLHDSNAIVCRENQQQHLAVLIWTFYHLKLSKLTFLQQARFDSDQSLKYTPRVTQCGLYARKTRCRVSSLFGKFDESHPVRLIHPEYRPHCFTRRGQWETQLFWEKNMFITSYTKVSS